MPRVFDPDLGKGYGKPDLERLGLFVEMPYMNGKKYVSPFEPPKRHKGMTFLTTGYKSKNGTQHGYFEEEFRRLFEGEGIPWRKPKQTGRKKKKIGPLSPFIVGNRGKTISTPGDYFGTFSGKIDAFSNVRRKKPKYVSPKANFQTNNPKKGGPGYVNICINPYPTHMRDPYKYVPKKKKTKKVGPTEPMYTAIHPEAYFTSNPFIDPERIRPGPVYVQRKEKKVKYSNITFIPTGPAKWVAKPGGCHGGCFDPFPEWKRCKYVSMLQANKPFIGDKGTFYPQSKGQKTLFTRSVLQYNTDLKVNIQNYKKTIPTYTKYLLNC